MPEAPRSLQFIQQEAINGVNPNNPVPESLLFAMAGSLNAMLALYLPVGSILSTMLDVTTFQSQIGNPNPVTWVLADGSSHAGSAYNLVTGNTNVPDLRGVFLRGANGSRSTSTGNTDGDLALGTYEADEFLSHNHNWVDPGHSHTFNLPVFFRAGNYQLGIPLISAYDQTSNTSPPQLEPNSGSSGITFNAQGGNESRARNVTINWLIRIN